MTLDKVSYDSLFKSPHTVCFLLAKAGTGWKSAFFTFSIIRLKNDDSSLEKIVYLLSLQIVTVDGCLYYTYMLGICISGMGQKLVHLGSPQNCFLQFTQKILIF